MAVPIRVRGPKGISTIGVILEDPTTVGDLQQLIFSVTEIPPTLQNVKTGYPPKTLTLVPSHPISSLGLNRGDQLIVSSFDSQGDRLLQTHHSKPDSPASLMNKKSAGSTVLDEAPLIPPSSPPLPRSRPAEPDDAIFVDGSWLVLRVVPDDNSCLFSSVAVVFEQNIDFAPKLRQIVADTIKNDPEQYTEAFLGQSPESYVTTILKPVSWGGAIELSIFAAHYKTEISSFDVETGRCDRFGEDKYDKRCILMYSGIHYDATSLAPTRNAPLDFHETYFPVSSEAIFDAAGRLASIRRAKRAYTNTTTFDLRCQICGKGLRGQKQATEHAKETGHVEFGEY